MDNVLFNPTNRILSLCLNAMLVYYKLIKIDSKSLSTIHMSHLDWQRIYLSTIHMSKVRKSAEKRISEYYPHVSGREKARIRRTLEIGDDPSLRFFPGLRFPHLMSPFFPPTELEWLCFCLFPQQLHILSVESRITCNPLSARYCWLPKRNKTKLNI